MAAVNGFTATAPDARYGDAQGTGSNGICIAQKFTAPGTGTLTITEIGAYVYDSDGVFKMAILEDDAAHNCPSSTQVANSETAQQQPGLSSMGKHAVPYSGTKPTLTGGTVYWLAIYVGSGGQYISRFATGGTSGYVSATYATWPTDTSWHSINATDYDYSLYAVYATAVSGKPNYYYAQL